MSSSRGFAVLLNLASLSQEVHAALEVHTPALLEGQAVESDGERPFVHLERERPVRGILKKPALPKGSPCVGFTSPMGSGLPGSRRGDRGEALEVSQGAMEVYDLERSPSTGEGLAIRHSARRRI